MPRDGRQRIYDKDMKLTHIDGNQVMVAEEQGRGGAEGQILEKSEIRNPQSEIEKSAIRNPKSAIAKGRD